MSQISREEALDIAKKHINTLIQFKNLCVEIPLTEYSIWEVIFSLTLAVFIPVTARKSYGVKTFLLAISMNR